MRALIPVLVALFLSVTVSAHAADTPHYAEGQFYTRIDNASTPEDPSRVRVQEFFWYGCPHCFHFDPLLNAWIKKLPADVVFEHVPDNLGHALGKLHEQAFYTATVLGIEHKIHTPLFRAIHVEHQQLRSKDALRDFFVRVGGISRSQFDNAWGGFQVDRDMRRADHLAKQDRILAVPTLVVAGQYKLEGGLPGYAAMGGSESSHFHKMLKVADYLIDKVRKQRAASTQ